MSGALGWLGRLVFTVLSLLATFSIIGSIAAIPSGSVEGRLGIERPQAYVPVRSAPEQPGRPVVETSAEPSMPQPGAGGSQMVETVLVAPERDNLLRWLEPLTYGVIALAGLMAIAILFLWRIAAALDARR